MACTVPVALLPRLAYVLDMTRRDLGPKAERPRLELALEAAGLGEFEWDMARDVFAVSKRMAAITGLPAGEMPGRQGRAFEAYVHPDDIEGVRARHAVNLDAGGLYEYEFRCVRPDDGRIVWVRVAGVLTVGPNHQPSGIIGIVEDIISR